MTQTTDRSIAMTESRPRVVTAEARKARPVLWWAAFGAICTMVAIAALAGWILSGQAVRTPTGVTPVPDYMRWNGYLQQVIGVGLLIPMIYYIVIRPWRREGHISLDGTILLAVMMTYWQDPLANYFGSIFSYNSTLINWGSWAPHIPGWYSANQQFQPETPFFGGMWYSFGLYGGIVLACGIMRKAKQRRPQMGVVGIVLVAFACMAILDLIMEVIYVRMGLYVYTGVIGKFTLFHDKYYQFPLYEMFLFGGTWTAMACLRYFKNDKGQTFAERGIDQLRVSPKKKHTLRLFAICGVLNLFYLCFYNMPIWWTAQHADPWPQDILKRSYFTNQVCGPGTDIQCQGDVVSVTGRGKASITPAGTVHVPEGKQLPPPLRADTK